MCVGFQFSMLSEQWAACVLIVGILVLGIIAVCLLITHVDGYLVGLICTIIGGLCGWTGKGIYDKRRSL